MSVTTPEPPAAESAPPPGPAAARRRLGGGFGPLSWPRVLVLVVAVAFLAGSVGWAVGQRDRDPLSSTDVGFLQDMGFHHLQAVQLSLILLNKEDVDPDLKRYAEEILVSQRYEQGIFNALLDRFGHPIEPGDEVMGWMGPPLPRDQMEGLATEEQVQQLQDAGGAEAEALWIALMSEHHLGGLHMADEAARHGSDGAVVSIAKSMVRTQRGEVIDLSRYRTAHDLPIPEGFGDPARDQRLNPLSARGD